MRTRRVSFGWRVTLSFSVMAFLASGIHFAVGPFLKPMVAELGLDRASFSLVIAIVGGASMSGRLAAASALSAEIFGCLSVGSVFGMMFLVHQTGSALGSWLLGALFEATGGYGMAFGLASALLVGAALLSVALDERTPAAVRLLPVAGGR